MEGEQMKVRHIEMLIANIKIVREYLDDVIGDYDWSYAKYEAALDELVYKLYKKQEEWSKEK